MEQKDKPTAIAPKTLASSGHGLKQSGMYNQLGGLVMLPDTCENKALSMKYILNYTLGFHRELGRSGSKLISPLPP